MTGLLRHGKVWRERNGRREAFEREYEDTLRVIASKRARSLTDAERAEVRVVALDYWQAAQGRALS